ncbi:MAG: hypothetical protein LC777_05175 [Actinobacteria bacterium]|nr:hypothetical protein [Actinomycetota bacterium]
MFGFRSPVLAAAFAAMVAIALALGLAQSASARPTTGQFQVEFTYVDEGASAACGFPVTFHQLDRGTYELFYDQQGNLTRVQVQTLTDGTVTANGITLLEHGRENNFYNVLTGVQMAASLEFRVWLPGLGVVIMDRGRLLFDADGNVVFEAGPHPALEGDFSALCAALTP